MYVLPEEITNLFKDFEFIENFPMIRGFVPDMVMEELEEFTIICQNIKNGKSSSLLRHRTSVSKNYYQLSVPAKNFESSSTHAFLNYAGEYVFSKLNNEIHQRQFSISKNAGHYDAFDFWINFYKTGDFIEEHCHSGAMSGVIFFTDVDEQDATFFDDGGNLYSHAGKKGEILIFSSELPHWSSPSNSLNEKISFSFNLHNMLENNKQK